MSKLTPAGVWLEGRIRDDYVLIDREDFSVSEAEEIFSQLGEYALTCERRGRYDIVPAKAQGKEYFVLVNAAACIELPRLQDGKKGRTLDQRSIPTYVHCYTEEERKRIEKGASAAEALQQRE